MRGEQASKCSNRRTAAFVSLCVHHAEFLVLVGNVLYHRPAVGIEYAFYRDLRVLSGGVGRPERNMVESMPSVDGFEVHIVKTGRADDS
ncbi:MAG: hypothetical protein GF344_08275 [Chitinivibrionales bacterium]|nr:hypothetical protein [Chitinivibrionales bacterium]